MKGATVAQLAGIILAIVFITIGLAIILPKMGKSSKDIESAKSIAEVKDPSKFIEVCTNFRNSYYLPSYFNENWEDFSSLGSFCKDSSLNWQICVRRCGTLLYFHNILSRRPITCSDIVAFCRSSYLGITGSSSIEDCENTVFNAIKNTPGLVNSETSLCKSVKTYNDFNAMCNPDSNSQTTIDTTICNPYDANDPNYIINIRYLQEMIIKIHSGGIND